jgi:hypothetical protein
LNSTFTGALVFPRTPFSSEIVIVVLVHEEVKMIDRSIKISLLRKVKNSIIFSCLTPNPPIGGEHLKIIELGRSPFGACLPNRQG